MTWKKKETNKPISGSKGLHTYILSDRTVVRSLPESQYVGQPTAVIYTKYIQGKER
jgi:hypothetical protein